MKANDSSQVSGKAARGKRHTAKPSPKTALAGGEPDWTPGPWGIGPGMGVEGPEDITDAKGEMVATTFPMSSGRGSSVANAYLISAVHEMYAVLDHIVQGVIDVHVVQMAREAMAKARGENASKHVNRKPMKAQ